MLIRATWRKITEPHSIAFILLVSLLLRLVIIPLFFDDYNYWAFGVFTNFLVHGQDPYHIVSQDPTLLNINPWRYPPFYLVFTIPAVLIEQATGQSISYLAVLKLPLAISDIITSYFLYRILLRSHSKSTSLKFSAMFALNPLVIFESSGGGFNDPIAIAFTVSSLYFLLRRKGSRVADPRDLSISAVLLGLGIALKIYPLMMIPVFLRELEGKRSRILYAIEAMLPAIAFSVPFFIWDWTSYIQLLTVRNVGGQHPLFPAFELGSLAGLSTITVLAGVLVAVYLFRMPLSSRLTLLFLWINLAIFSTSFNYMVWGIPFFTWFVAENRRLFLLPFSPVITFVIALVYQGSYNAVGGSAGVFYWTYHILRLPLVLSLEFPWLGFLEFIGLVLSEVVAGYYFAFVLLKSKTLTRARPPLMPALARFIPSKSKVLPPILLGLVIVSWGFVVAEGTFLPHRYPTADGNLFTFSDSFRSGLLDYQWVFSGQGTYAVVPQQFTIETASSVNGTSEVYRGWGSTVNGFLTTSSATVTLSFRFEALASSAKGMTLINMTDDLLAVETLSGLDFVYVDHIDNSTRVLFAADNLWHNFSMRYSEVGRVLQIDNSTWQMAAGTFDRLVLGNSNSRASFGGSAAFSNVTVEVGGFPTGYQSVFASYLSILAPLGVVCLFFVLLLFWGRRTGKGEGEGSDLRPGPRLIDDSG